MPVGIWVFVSIAQKGQPMPTVEATIRIEKPAEGVFALSQDYGLRKLWDPFVREMRFLDGARAAGNGTRVWVRAWTGLTMEAQYVSYRPPRSVAMKMRRGPWFFSMFAGTWIFEPDGCDATVVTFRYAFRTRW